MARKKGVRIVLLVEDRNHERLALDVLLKLGYTDSELLVVRYETGKGSAEQRVRKGYPIEVEKYRRKKNHQRIGLLVCIDADQHSVQTRSKHLADELAKGKLNPRGRNERIAHWIPKWNVETWILHLTGSEVDEERSYKDRLKDNADVKGAAAEFSRQFQEFGKGTTPKLPALATAFQETRRLQDQP